MGKRVTDDFSFTLFFNQIDQCFRLLYDQDYMIRGRTMDILIRIFEWAEDFELVLGRLFVDLGEQGNKRSRGLIFTPFSFRENERLRFR